MPGLDRSRPRRWRGAPGFGGRSDDLVTVHPRDLFRAVAQLSQNLVGMLPQQRGAGNLRREAGELDRAADSQILAALLLLHLDDTATSTQGRIVFDFLHR